MGQCSVCSVSEPIQPSNDAAAWPDQQFQIATIEPRKSISHRWSVSIKSIKSAVSTSPNKIDNGTPRSDESPDICEIDGQLTPCSSPTSAASVDTILSKFSQRCHDSPEDDSSKSAKSLKNLCSTLRRNSSATNRSGDLHVTAEEVVGTAIKMAQRLMNKQADTEKLQQQMVLDLILYLQLPRKLISLSSRESMLRQEAEKRLNKLGDSEVSSWIENVTGQGRRMKERENRKQSHSSDFPLSDYPLKHGRDSFGEDIALVRKITMSGDENFNKLEKRLTMMSQPDLCHNVATPPQKKLMRSLSGAFHSGADGLTKMMYGISSLSVSMRSARLFRMIHTNKELHECLDKIGTWEFNAFDMLHFTKRPLTVVTLYAMNLFDLFNKFHIRLTVWLSFIEKIESEYRDNPYHNSTHAADVLAAELFWLTKSEDVVCKFEPIDFLTCIIGACIHDVGHPGTTSDFEIRASSDIAIQYNDTSVLENYHLSVTFNIIKRSRYNIFARFSDPIRTNIRKALIDMVLTTDVSKHLEHVALVKDYLLQKEILEQLQISNNDTPKSKEEESNTSKVQHINSREPKYRVSVSSQNEIDTSHFMTRSEVRALLRNISLKVSDLSNPTRPLNIALQWTERIITEFHMQGDKERELGLSVTPMMDRTTANIELSQLAFIDHIIIPLYESWFQMVKVTMVPIQNLIITRNYWIIKAEEKTGIEQTVLRKKNQQLHRLLAKHYMHTEARASV